MTQTSIILSNFAEFARIVQDVSIVLGIGMVFAGLHKAKKHGEMRAGGQAGGVASFIALLVCGSVLLSLPSILRAFLMGFWNTDSPLMYSHDFSISDMMAPVIMFVRILGVIAFIRGVLLLSKHGEQHQQGHYSRALLHLLGGIMCVNVIASAELLQQVMGFI